VLWVLERRWARSCVVCAVMDRLETCCQIGCKSPSDTTGEVLVLVRWVVLLCIFATQWHCRELSDERYADHSQFKYWLQQRLTPGITDRSPLVLRRQQSVLSLSSTCHDASAALRLLLVASYVFLVTFSVLYYVIDSFPCLSVSILSDTVFIVFCRCFTVYN